MAAKEQKLSATAMWIGIVIVLYLVNYAALQLWQFPVVYCVAKPFASVFYTPFAEIMNLCALAYFAFQIVKRNIGGVLVALGIVNIVFGLPMIAQIIFGGGSCS